MIYPTLKECLEECRHTGVLRIEAKLEDEYVLGSAGWRPRLTRHWINRPEHWI